MFLLDPNMPTVNPRGALDGDPQSKNIGTYLK